MLLLCGMDFKKIATITDLHFGRNGNNQQANQDNIDFLTWFIDRAKTRGCETLICMGDWHDNRASLAISTMEYSLLGMDMLNDAFKQILWIPGNHDLVYRDRRDVSSISFAKYLSNVTIARNILTIGDVTILPWLIGEERKKLKRIKSRYIFSHLEANGGFMMNARVPMPDHPNSPDASDFVNQEYVFSGHFHFRQAKDNIVYTGNIFPFNFADDGDSDRGAMFLEWGKDPEFESWPDQPLYRSMSLSSLLNQPDKLLKQKMTVRATLDMDISFEEAQVLRDEYIKLYGLRKIELIHQAKKNMDQEFAPDVVFQSVEQIVVDGLMSVQSDTFKPSKLVEIYRALSSNEAK